MPRYRVDKNVRESVYFTADQRNIIAATMPDWGADSKGLRMFIHYAVNAALEEWATQIGVREDFMRESGVDDE